MGRGAQQNVQTQGNNLLDTEKNLVNQNNTQAQGERSFLMPQLQGMVTNPGYTGAEKGAITNATEGGIGAAFGTGQQQQTDLAARTGNAAGIGANQDALTRERMRVSGDTAAQNQVKFADAARSDRDRGLSAIQGLFGTQTGATGQNLGNANATLNTLNSNANQPGFWSQFMQQLGGGLGKGLVPSYQSGGFGIGG